MIIIKMVGGLGNQLFQYATAKALALKYNTELKFDLSFYDLPENKNAFRLSKFNIPIIIGQLTEWENLINRKGNLLIRSFKKVGIKFPPFYRDTHIVEGDILKLFADDKSHRSINIYLEGWFGNEKYFKEYRNLLLKEFDMTYALNEKNKSFLSLINNSNSIAVHIRRGDYISNPFFHNLSSEYYLNSIEYIKNKVDNPVFYFFSDDIQWVKKEYSFLKEAIFIEGNSNHEGVFTTNGDIEDLMLMRSCKHNIIANSTFSWWAAWLNINPKKTVIAPKVWYNNKQAQLRYEKNDFIPEQWLKM